MSAPLTKELRNWLAQLNETVPRFLESLTTGEGTGRYFPCKAPLTSWGQKMRLGFSCFALKIFYTLKLWERLPKSEQENWITFLYSYQQTNISSVDPQIRGAFIDPATVEGIRRSTPLRMRVRQFFDFSGKLSPIQRLYIAETKQVIATLTEVGAKGQTPFSGFPQTPKAFMKYMKGLDWSSPWAAGGQTSALAVFFRTQGPQLLGSKVTKELLRTCSSFLEGCLHSGTGAYFTGAQPAHGELVNGAMKVLTALDWLEVPIHLPERLTKTCLLKRPNASGCHLVDAIYVLYRCQKAGVPITLEIRSYCLELLNMIQRHYREDGGFSYSENCCQRNYYGAIFSEGQKVGDIHGTILLVWAISMLSKLLELDLDWKVIRP